MTEATDIPKAEVVLHPGATFARLVDCRRAGYNRMAKRDGYWRTMDHDVPPRAARKRAPTNGFRPGPPTGGPGGGKAA